MSSGQYYIQVYTNWMNNFAEDESTLVKINVINPQEGIKNYTRINQETLALTLHPEGGHYLKNSSNIIGVQLADCRGNAPENLEGTIVNSQGVALKTFKLNQFGFGRFEISALDDAQKVVVDYNGRSIEKALEAAEPFGFGLEVNNFTLEGKTIIKVKTNPATVTLLASKKLYLLAHQDQKYTLIDLPLTLENTLSLDDADLFEGLTTLRIIDSDQKEWAERLIYIYPKTENKIRLVKGERKADKYQVVGYSTYPNSISSLTVLPQETVAKDIKTNTFNATDLWNIQRKMKPALRTKLTNRWKM
jgi:hypothetical protein